MKNIEHYPIELQDAINSLSECLNRGEKFIFQLILTSIKNYYSKL